MRELASGLFDEALMLKLVLSVDAFMRLVEAMLASFCIDHGCKRTAMLPIFRVE